VRGDLLLDTELIEFFHDAVSQPGQCGWYCAPNWWT